MSNDLILCLALDKSNGRGAQALARLMHASARLNGWKKDFVVIHNRPESFFDHYKPRKTDYEIQLKHDWEGRFQSQGFKMQLDTLVDLSERDRVMFCDIDTMFFDSPQLFFDASDVDISFARETIPIVRKQFNSCLSDKQMESFARDGTLGINSGQFVIRNKKAVEVFQTWRETLTKDWERSNKEQDQGPFNRMIYSQKFSTEEFPKNYVLLPFGNRRPVDHWDAKLVHYCGWRGATKMRFALQEFVGGALIRGKDHADMAERLIREAL